MTAFVTHFLRHFRRCNSPYFNTSRKEEPEPTAEPAQEPTEAPAEPTQAPQITQQPEDRAVTTNGVKTGDDSPLTQLAFMLFAASAAILLIIFLKKKDEKI